VAGTPSWRFSHSGLREATTKSTATATVTAWEKMSQILRMERLRMASQSAIEAKRDNLLDVGRVRDYGPNGLRVEVRAGPVHSVRAVDRSPTQRRQTCKG
jgi:hypothetical protein